MTDKSIPACQFGYLTLTSDSNNKVYVKANKITSIVVFENDDEDDDAETAIACGEESCVYVIESIEQILTQIEAIHPSLR